MNKKTIGKFIGIAAYVLGGIVLLIVGISVFRDLTMDTPLENDWRGILLKSGSLIGLGLAYRWKLLGGLIATLAIFISGFLHPLIFMPGLLYILSWMLMRDRD